MLNISSSRKFEFVTSHEQPSKAANDASRRKLVRTQAKRYSLEAHPLLPASRSKGRPANINAYKGRFHLETIPKMANEDSGSRAILQKQNGIDYKLVTWAESDNGRVDRHVLDHIPPQHPGSLPRSLGVAVLDPFDTLAIEIGAQEELLFKHG